jgi:hypothetical protein
VKPARPAPEKPHQLVPWLAVVGLAVGIVAMLLYAGKLEKYAEDQRITRSAAEDMRDQAREELRQAREAPPPPKPPAKPEAPPEPGLTDE